MCYVYFDAYERVMSHMNESCHVGTSHVTYERVMSHMNESCPIWTSDVTYEWVMSHMNKSCHVWTSHVTYERVMSHMNKSCHVWTSHVKYEWVMSHMNESCHICVSHATWPTNQVHATICTITSDESDLWENQQKPMRIPKETYKVPIIQWDDIYHQELQKKAMKLPKETYESTKREPWEYQKRLIKFESRALDLRCSIRYLYRTHEDHIFMLCTHHSCYMRWLRFVGFLKT